MVGYQNLALVRVIYVLCIISNLDLYFQNLDLTKTKVFLNIKPGAKKFCDSGLKIIFCLACKLKFYLQLLDQGKCI